MLTCCHAAVSQTAAGRESRRRDTGRVTVATRNGANHQGPSVSSRRLLVVRRHDAGRTEGGECFCVLASDGWKQGPYWALKVLKSLEFDWTKFKALKS